jgi:hypothetical protein
MNIQDAWANRISHTHGAATQGSRTSQRHARHAPFAQRAMQVSTGLVCLWSLLETPWEWTPGDDPARFAALLVSKCLLLAVGMAAIAGVRYARVAFAFLCAASVLAVSSTLTFVYGISHPLFVLALVECVLRAAVVASCAVWCLGKASAKKAR